MRQISSVCWIERRCAVVCRQDSRADADDIVTGTAHSRVLQRMKLNSKVALITGPTLHGNASHTHNCHDLSSGKLTLDSRPSCALRCIQTTA